MQAQDRGFLITCGRVMIADLNVAAALRHADGLHGLINCAGIGPAEKVVGREGPQSLANIARTIEVNLIGAFNMLRQAAHAMSLQEPGPDGERGVVAMTLPLARQLARHGIRVMTIAPGLMETPMLKALPTEVQDALGRTVTFAPRAASSSKVPSA